MKNYNENHYQGPQNVAPPSGYLPEGQPVAPVASQYGYPAPPQGYYQPGQAQGYPPAPAQSYYYGPSQPTNMYYQTGIPPQGAVMNPHDAKALRKKQKKDKKKKKKNQDCCIYACLGGTLCALCLASN